MINQVNYFNSGLKLFSRANSEEAGQFIKPVFHRSYDFENIRPEDDSLMFSTAQKHSGKMSLHYSTTNEFGLTIKLLPEEIKLNDSSTIWLKAWVYCDHIPFNATLVLQVDNDNKTIFWKGSDTKDYILKTGWQPVFLAYKFNERLPKNATLSIYLWNHKDNFYADDISISILP